MRSASFLCLSDYEYVVSEFMRELGLVFFILYSYLFQFVLSMTPDGILRSRYQSGGQLIIRPLSSGTQDFQTDPKLYPLNQPVMKLEAAIQCSGEAQYVNGIPRMPNEVHGAFVLSTVHNGAVDTVDIENALVS